MAQTFSTGPVHIGFCYGGFQASPNSPSTADIPTSSSYYYGTTREGPDISEEPSYFNVMNDLAGPKIPLDRGYAGSEHTITLVMTRWDGALDITFDRMPNSNAATATGPIAVGPDSNIPAGSEGGLDRGVLISRISSLQMLLFLSNGGIGGIEPAIIKWRRYFQTVCIGPNKPIWGNKEDIRVRIFKAQNVFKGIILTGPGGSINNATPAFRLFDEGTNVLPGPFATLPIV